jgi:dihydroxyacetone kinase-like protein
MESFQSSHGKEIVLGLVKAIQDNAAYLSEIDGAIGDGDHGINMNKGFTLTQTRIGDQDVDLSAGLELLGNTLLTEIGGAMGPLYGTFFIEMADASAGKAEIDSQTFGSMLDAALDAVQDLGSAKLGDKTLLDTLIPARSAYHEALASGKSFAEALQGMAAAAEAGKEGTRDMVAKIGRASRLGERSRGHLDAGATSCNLILQALASSMIGLLTS